MSKHLLKFDTESAYKTAKRNHLIVPNVSLVASPYNVHVNSALVSMGDAVAGDIIAYDLSDNQKVIKAEAWETVKNKGYKPEGIIVVPVSHTQDGTVKAMSLHFMDAENAAGATSEKTLAWGPNALSDDVAGLTNYTSAVCGEDGSLNPTLSTHNPAFMPSDAFYYGGSSDKGTESRQNGVKCFMEGMQYYYESGNGSSYDKYCIPSPYLADGSRNPNFYASGQSNVMNEFGKGQDNTDVLYNIMSADGHLEERKSILKNGITLEDGETKIGGNNITCIMTDGSFTSTTADGSGNDRHYMRIYKANDGKYYGVGGYGKPNGFEIWTGWVSGKVKGTDYYYTYPAALATKLYGTSHKSAGNWFLPDMAQLALTMPYKDRIKYALTTLSTDYAAAWINSWLWSSSEYNSYHAWYLNPSHGHVGNYYKDSSYRVRAFAAFNA